MTDYKSQYAPNSLAAEAATKADAEGGAAAEDHALIPPTIELTPDYVHDQQKKFRELAAGGYLGAQALVDVYVEDERLQGMAGVTYGHFAGAARLATAAVCRYDSLRGSLDQDHDVATNFDLGKGTKQLATSALDDANASDSDGSLTGAMSDWKQARRGVASAHKRVQGVLFRMRARDQDRRKDAEEGELAKIDANIKIATQVGAGIGVLIAAITGTGHRAMLGAATFGNAWSATKGYAGGVTKAAGADVDVGSIAGLAKLGAQIYYAEDIAALKTKIAASKATAGQLDEVADRCDVEATFDELDQAVDQFERTAKVAESALERRRRQFAKAGAKVDADAQSGGAEEGEVGESLLLGSAALEAGLLVGSAREAGADAFADVTTAYNHTKERRAPYWTEEETISMNGHRHLLPHSRADHISDDPDVTALYQMQHAIKRWQTAATEATEHLDATKGAFTAGIGAEANVDEY